jgi:putative membrane protein
MGSYKTVFGALGNLTEDPSNNIPTVVAFMAGAVVGLLTFARVLKWLFKHYRNLTLALLTGFMIGSLNKIWPWKEVTEYRTNSHGEQVPFLERSISPDAFERISGADPQLLLSLVLIVVGMAVILIMAKLAPSEEA